MANKDYVRRGRSPKKPAPKKSTSRRKPWRSGLLAIILAGLFGYGLYILSNDPEPPAPVAVKPAAKPKPKKTETIPPPPTEKWDYVDTLPKREIEVVAKEQEISEIPYIMQCGAYKTMHQEE